MDIHTLTIIIITAVVSTIAKELASWFVRRTATVAITVKNAFIKYVRVLDIILAGLLPVWLFGCAFWLSHSGTPITGGVVFGTALLIGVGFWYLREFEHKLLAYKRDPSV
jgi:hypothetical protein